MPRFPQEQLIDFGVRLLVQRGVSREPARYLAETAVATDAFGIHTHGVVLYAFWDKFIGVRIDPAAEPAVARQTPATALIDGRGGFGQLALRLARQVAVEKARTQGCASVAGVHLSWLAALGPQILPLAKAGLFAQCWAQHNEHQDCAPWGGIDPKFSTNPVALAFPTHDLPVLSDFSTSAISIGKTRELIRAGQTAPENLYMDRDGRPTPDPRVAKEGGGSIFFMGGERYGYRGYAFSLWAEALAAMAGGSANNPDAPPEQSFHLTVIDPEAFGAAGHYEAEMKRFIAYLKASRPRPGFDGVRLPGERAQAASRDAEARGIAVNDRLVALLNEVAARNGIEGLPTSS